VTLLEGFCSVKLAHTAPSYQIYSAVHASDSQPVWCKVFSGVSRDRALARAEAELATLTRLAPVGIGRPLEATFCGDAAVLVFERTAGIESLGVSLEYWIESESFSVAEFLDISCALSEQIELVHRSRMLVVDLCPAKILVDSASSTVHLIDFDRSQPLGAGRKGTREDLTSFALRTNLAYIAPEASGRMGRGVDQRSDLYSLGAVLYHALTGVPPFDAQDPLSLIHAHIAKQPRIAVEVRPGVPLTLSRIVSKLLQKSPEDRYQTAYALSRDLFECRAQLTATRTIPVDMALGSSDVPHRPLFSRELFGRDAEVQRLKATYDEVRHGRSRIVLLSGPPGMGKSELVNSLRAPVAESHGYITVGKFEQERPDVPYSAFVQAFSGLAQQILTESDVRLQAWRSALIGSTGPIAGALVSLAPDIGIVLGPVPPVPPLGTEQTRARLGLAVRLFLRAAAKPEHPLVLVLDDLQWADSASRELLRELVLHSESESLLVIGAYRSDDIDEGTPLTHIIEELRELGEEIESLELSPLSQEACESMLSAALGRDVDDVHALARCVSRKTNNVPLLIQQFIYYCYDLGLIQFAPGRGWVWDDSELATAPVPEDAVSMITAKLTGLPPAPLEVLELASCAGSCFDLATLNELSKRPKSELEGALFHLCDEGLIVPAPSGFRFVHDRIAEAATLLSSTERRGELHRSMAQRTLSHSPVERLGNGVFELADHLILAEHFLDRAERDIMIRVGLAAGKAALASGASETADRYLSAALRQFRDEHWNADPTQCFELFLQSAEAARHAKQFERALALLDVLDTHSFDLLRSAQVAAKRIAVTTMSTPPERSIDMILPVLRQFGIHWPRHPSLLRLSWEILRTQYSLRGPLDESTFRGHEHGDVRPWLAKMIVLGASGGAIAMSSSRLLGMLIAYMLRSYRTYGAGPGLAGVLATWAALRIARFLDGEGAGRYAEAALEWARRSADPVSAAKANYLVLAYVHPAIRSRRDAMRPLHEVSERLFEVGDYEFATYALLVRAFHMALIGEPIREVLAEFEGLAARTRGTSSPVSVENPRALLQLLQDGVHAPGEPVDLGSRAQVMADAIQGRMGARFGVWSIAVMALCVLGRFDDVLKYSDPSTCEDSSAHEGVFGADLLLYRGLAAGAGFRTARSIVQRLERARELRRCSSTLASWARLNRDFWPAAHALHAEWEFTRGRSARSLALYARAATVAGQQGYANQAALFYERRSALLTSLRRITEAGVDVERAATWYAQWGAHAKAATLRG